MSEDHRKAGKTDNIFFTDSSDKDINNNNADRKCLFCGIFTKDPKIIGMQIKRPSTPFNKTNQTNREFSINNNYDLYTNYQRAYIEINEMNFTLEHNI